MKKILSVLLASSFMLFAFGQVAYAQAPEDPCAKLQSQFDKYSSGEVVKDLPKYCTESKVYNRIINLLYYFIVIAAVIAGIYGGYLYMASGANEAQTKKGREVLKWVIIGLVVALVATVLVNIVIKALVDNEIF